MNALRAVSVFIPAYNAAETIPQTIASVVAAADEAPDTSVEVVVVDDGSTDRTREVVEEVCAADARVHVYAHRANRGGAAARNTAVELASHEWVYCVDADNLLDAKSFRRVTEMGASGEWDVVAPAETRYFASDPERPTHSWFWDGDRLDVSDVLRMYETPVASGNYLFRVGSWARAGGYPEFAGSLDAWGFGVRLLFEGARFGVCADSFYLHRQGHDSYYVRDTDNRRAVAAAQILLPYMSRLSATDRERLLGDGELLEYFSQLPDRPLHVSSGAATSGAARIVRPPAKARQDTTAPSSRARAALRHAWVDAPPKLTMQRALRALSRRGGSR